MLVLHLHQVLDTPVMISIIIFKIAIVLLVSSLWCFFKPTSEEETIKVIIIIIKKIGSRKSPRLDGMKSDLVKQIAEEISLPLKIIFDISLHTGSAPDNLKIAKVVPIYKKDNPELFGNYKPVSVLSCFSKIIERIVYERCYDFLIKNNILYKRQYEFRNKHSTYTAVLDFMDDINKATDNKMYTAGIFMDLSKIFDTIDHEILLDKLYHYGFRGVSHAWFTNYPSNRKQMVSYNSTLSSSE